MSRTSFLNSATASLALAATHRHSPTPQSSLFQDVPLSMATLSRASASSDPGDTLRTAERLGSVSGTVTRYGTVSPTDTDLFKVNLQQRSTLRVRVRNRSTVAIVGVMLDSNGRIMVNGRGEKLIGRIAPGEGKLYGKPNAPRGGYFIKVFSNQGSRNPYTLVVTVDADCGCT